MAILNRLLQNQVQVLASGSVAQGSEQGSHKSSVAGSSPATPITYGLLAQLVERLPCKQKVIGSNPIRSIEGRSTSPSATSGGNGIRSPGADTAV